MQRDIHTAGGVFTQHAHLFVKEEKTIRLCCHVAPLRSLVVSDKPMPHTCLNTECGGKSELDTEKTRMAEQCFNQVLVFFEGLWLKRWHNILERALEIEDVQVHCDDYDYSFI